MGIEASLVKALRQKTGVGMMDCKKALLKTSGDMDKAVNWLREQGLAQAAKKSGRVADQGVVAIHVAGKRGVLVEVSAETDFVARNEQFQKMARGVAELALTVQGDVKRLLDLPWHGESHTVEEEIRKNVLSVGENLVVRRAAYIKADFLGQYVHGAVAPGMGRIGVLVGLRSGGQDVSVLAKELAMHIAALSPLAVTVEDLDPQFLERERAFLTKEAQKSKKPPEIVEKILEGRLRKFYEEVVLLSQGFVKDEERTVAQVMKEAEKGAPIQVSGFLRYALGESVNG